jgi:hypothetical protein
MPTNQIAERLVELCHQGQFETAQKELFANDALSIEPYATPDFEKETKGLDAILEKGEKWNSILEEMHSLTVSDPLIASNSFACTMRIEVTMKESGRMDKTELCVYTVKDDKIISKEFFM